jgi:hypothetical protein
MLTSKSEAKIGQWANEARRLKARELREYVPPRRFSLLLAALRNSRGRVLDDMTVMLLRRSKKVVWMWITLHCVQALPSILSLTRLKAIDTNG